MKYVLRIVAISVLLAGMIASFIALIDRLCDSYSKLLFKNDPDDYYSWPV